jgi:hypothetical protein
MSALCLFVLLLFADPKTSKPSPSPSPSVSPPAAPTVSVSLERSMIREVDTVPVTIWLSNQASQVINDVRVEIARPDFLDLSSPQCDGQLVGSTVTFGDVPANSSVNCKLYLVTTRYREIIVGEYNLLFTFQYQWRDNNGVHKSVVTAEKPVKVNLLGTDSVAGIPLALAGFIIPGLFFWIAIRLLKVPWGVDFALGDKTIYSIIISSLFMLVGTWYDYVNLRNGISLIKLGKLAGAGFIVGVLLGGAYHIWHSWRQKRTAAYRISFGDEPTTTLGKILTLDSRYNPSMLRRVLARIFPAARLTKPRTIVKLRDDKEYVGSLGIRDGDLVALVGSFKILTAGVDQETIRTASRLEQEGNFRELLGLATQNQLTIEVNDQVRERSDNSAHDGAKIFVNSEVAYVRTEPNKKAFEPLILS